MTQATAEAAATEPGDHAAPDPDRHDLALGSVPRVAPDSTSRWDTLVAALRSERGAETAEYAIATMAAVAFAGLLVAIMQSDTVRSMLEGLVEQALTFVA